MPFNIGDIVYLKSESKAMTVIGYGSSQNNGYIDLANCAWLDKDNRYCQILFLFGEPAEFGKNRTLRFSGHP
ncbi:DUF2158 domain-containing protein [Escherichia coli]|uniref:DUF2158 domain-containing protein n=2 Tax=Escherichia coli TaxID=562 RepID=UPI00338D70FB